MHLTKENANMVIVTDYSLNQSEVVQIFEYQYCRGQSMKGIVIEEATFDDWITMNSPTWTKEQFEIAIYKKEIYEQLKFYFVAVD